MSTTAAGKRERTKQANREAILEAGRQVFAEIGFGAATVRDIIRGTDLASGTFYNYFPDKEAVFRALLEDSAERARQRVQEARACATSLEEMIRAGYLAYFSFMAEDPVTFDLARRNAGTMRALFDEPMLAGTADLQADLDAAVAAGLLPALDTELAAAAMVGAGVELGMHMLERETPDPASTADFATRLFLAGLPQ